MLSRLNFTTIKENLTKETNFFRPDTIRDICQKYF